MTKRNADVVKDREGQDLGHVTDIIPNPQTLQPEWIVVKSGRFGTEHLVPIAATEKRDHEYVVAADAELVKSTPLVEQHTPPTASQREAIYEHFGLKKPA